MTNQRWTSSGVTVLTLALLCTSVLASGVALADNGAVTGISVVDAEDRDCDGAVSAFSLRVTADTDCVGCNDESKDSPNIEPYLRFSADSTAASMNPLRTDELQNSPSFSRVYTLLKQLSIDDRGTVDVTVSLMDDDPLADDNIDERTISVEVEPQAEDPTSRPRARFTTSENKPLVHFTNSKGVPLTGETIKFDASETTTGGCAITDFRWDFDNDGTTDARGTDITRQFNEAGTKQAALTVIDERGVTDTATAELTVRSDTDGDGVADSQEKELGSNPEVPDTDDDSLSDRIDPFPTTIFLPWSIPVIVVLGVGVTVNRWGIPSPSVLAQFLPVLGGNANDRPNDANMGSASRSSSNPISGLSGSRNHSSTRGSTSRSSNGDDDTRVYSPENKPSDGSNNPSEPGTREHNQSKEGSQTGGSLGTCPGCGNSLTRVDSAAYCPNCGTELT